MIEQTRRAFIVGIVGAGAGTYALADSPQDDNPEAPPDDAFPRQELSIVREVVGASHRDFARVKALIDERPSLVNAAWDWGFGDWETGLGAASHVGRRDIAELLISRGARIDIFAAAMLGQLDTVRTIITACPGIQKTRGPHGISLLRHVEAGGDRAKEVAEYLAGIQGAGGDETPMSPDEDAKRIYLGNYRFGKRDSEQFEIKVSNQGVLEIQRQGGFAQRLFRTAEHEFHPPGAPAVRIRFEIDNGRARRATVTDGSRVIVGRRIIG